LWWNFGVIGLGYWTIKGNRPDDILPILPVKVSDLLCIYDKSMSAPFNSLKNRLLFICLLCLLVLLSSGCTHQVKDLVVETRFVETKEPVSGSLFYDVVYKISWPRPPEFEPVSSADGLFKIKMARCEIPGHFTLNLSGHKESLDYILDTKYDSIILQMDNSNKTSWILMRKFSNNKLPEVECRFILPSKEY